MGIGETHGCCSTGLLEKVDRAGSVSSNVNGLAEKAEPGAIVLLYDFPIGYE
jgi:hypothetical protein